MRNLQRSEMPAPFGTPEHFRERGKQARAVARNIGDPEAKSAMLRVAENFEEIARTLEAVSSARASLPHKI